MLLSLTTNEPLDLSSNQNGFASSHINAANMQLDRLAFDKHATGLALGINDDRYQISKVVVHDFRGKEDECRAKAGVTTTTTTLHPDSLLFQK